MGMRWWIWALLALLVLAMCAEAQNSTNTTTTKAPAKKKAEPELWEAIVVFIVVIIMLILLALEKGAPEFVMFGANIFFVVLGITNIKQAVAGFNNQGMLTVAVLFPIAFSLERTGAIEPIQTLFTKLAIKGGRARSLAQIICFAFFPLALLSGFINNTPLV